MDRIKGKSISRKIIISCLLLLIIASFTVRPTLAWLSATTDPVINYFAGGSIALTLDEAPVDADGQEIDGNRVQENHYKYMAGAKLDKDPTVTVLVGSEECYVYVCVDNELPDDFFSIDIDTDAWIEVETSDSSTIYRYVRTVDASEEDVVLAPVFTTVTVSAELTSEDIAELGTKTLAVTAFAIQTASLDKEAADELAVEYFFNGASIALLGSAVNNETGAEVTELTEEAEETEVTEVPEETEVAEETETAEEIEETEVSEGTELPEETELAEETETAEETEETEASEEIEETEATEESEETETEETEASEETEETEASEETEET